MSVWLDLFLAKLHDEEIGLKYQVSTLPRTLVSGIETFDIDMANWLTHQRL
jgi:hypothetical protein